LLDAAFLIIPARIFAGVFWTLYSLKAKLAQPRCFQPGLKTGLRADESAQYSHKGKPQE
jgi:hypothetical protein